VQYLSKSVEFCLFLLAIWSNRCGPCYSYGKISLTRVCTHRLLCACPTSAAYTHACARDSNFSP